MVPLRGVSNTPICQEKTPPAHSLQEVGSLSRSCGTAATETKEPETFCHSCPSGSRNRKASHVATKTRSVIPALITSGEWKCPWQPAGTTRAEVSRQKDTASLSRRDVMAGKLHRAFDGWGRGALLPSPSSVPSHLTHFTRPQQQSRGDSTLPQRTEAPLGSHPPRIGWGAPAPCSLVIRRPSVDRLGSVWATHHITMEKTKTVEGKSGWRSLNAALLESWQSWF